MDVPAKPGLPLNTPSSTRGKPPPRLPTATPACQHGTPLPSRSPPFSPHLYLMYFDFSLVAYLTHMQLVRHLEQAPEQSYPGAQSTLHLQIWHIIAPVPQNLRHLYLPPPRQTPPSTVPGYNFSSTADRAWAGGGVCMRLIRFIRPQIRLLAGNS
jgi:hypothetical protein